MRRSDPTIGFINLGHVLVHLFMLIFPTAVLALERDWNTPYSQLLGLSLGGLVAYGGGSLPAGWLGDRWSRRGMMVIFFFGTGVAAIATGFAQGPTGIFVGLTAIGLFASIYHPVGIALLVRNQAKVGRTLGINGVFGNFGIASAALITGALCDWVGWRAAFFLPGAIAIIAGFFFLMTVRATTEAPLTETRPAGALPRRLLLRVGLVLFVATICDSVIFNATTIAMPKVFAEHLAAFTDSTLGIGALLSIVYVVAAMAQLLVGQLIDKRGVGRVFLPVAALQVPLLIVASMSPGIAILPIAVALMFSVFGLIPILDAMVAVIVDERWRARVYAMGYVLSFGASPLAVPLIAYTHDAAGGFSTLFLALAAIGMGTVASALFLPQRALVRA
ncbi:MAG: MFS transporter [Hypericibacter sp.]